MQGRELSNQRTDITVDGESGVVRTSKFNTSHIVAATSVLYYLLNASTLLAINYNF